MSRDEIRRKTCIIIRKGNEFLVGTILWSTDLRWRRSPYDAWSTRDRMEAERVARAAGGEMVLFSPIVNRKKVLEA